MLVAAGSDDGLGRDQQLKLQLLRQLLSPEHEFQRLTAWRNDVLKWRDVAAKGEVPHDHPDARFVGNVLWALRDDPSTSLLPPKLASLLSARRAEVAKLEAKEAGPKPTTIGDDEIDDPRPCAVLGREAHEFWTARLNVVEPLKEGVKATLLDWLERNAPSAGLDDPTPSPPVATEDDDEAVYESFDATKQPHPKRAWLLVVVTYLDGLAPEEAHALPPAFVDAVLRLNADPDPVDNDPARASVSIAVRVLAAEASALLLAHGGNRDIAEHVVRAAKDSAPQVRRALFDSAGHFADREPEVFAEVLTEFAEREPDSFVLSWSQRHLFRYRDAQKSNLDASCASAIRRVVALYRAQQVGETNPFEEALAKLAGFAVEISERMSAGETSAFLRDSLPRTPSLASFVLEAIFYRLRAGARDAEALLQLVERVSIAVPTSPPASEELEHITRCGAVFAAALMNLGHVSRLPINLIRDPLNPEALVASKLWAHRDRLRTAWINLIAPWLTSPLVVQVQRFASDAACVLLMEAELDPCRAANSLARLRLHQSAQRFESRLADQLAHVGSNVMLRCEVFDASDRIAILALIDALASVGNELASNAARLYADRLRDPT